MPSKPYLLMIMITCTALIGCGDKSNEISPEPNNPVDTTTDANTDPSTTDSTETNPEETETSAGPLLIVAGQGIGGAELGTTFAEVRSVLGEPDTARGYNRMILCSWATLGMDITFSSPLDFEISDSAIALAMNTVSDTGFTGVATPGMEKSQIENALGVSTDETLGFSFYQEGIVVEYDENNISTKIGVYAPYVVRAEPPVMLPAATSMDEAQ